MRVDEIVEHTRPLFRWQQADMQLTPLVVAREASAVLDSFLATLVKRTDVRPRRALRGTAKHT